MRRTAAVLLLVSVTGVNACGGGGGAGSDCPGFARIVAGEFGRTGDRLWWTLEVAEIPAALTFNQADVQPFVMEYDWGVDVDSDSNGDTDLRVAVTHFRESGVAEVSTGDILSVTSEDLWTVSGPASSASGGIDVTITGNTFRMETDVAEDPGLALVTARGQSTWTTFHKYGPGLAEQCEDRRN